MNARPADTDATTGETPQTQTPESAATPPKRPVTQEDIARVQAVKDAEIAQIRAAAQAEIARLYALNEQRDDQAFLANLEAQGITGDEAEAAKMRRVAAKEFRQLQAAEQALRADKELIGKERLIANLLADNPGLTRKNIEAARSVDEMHDMVIGWYKRQTANAKRNTSFDAGQGGVPSVDISKLSPHEKLAMGVRLHKLG